MVKKERERANLHCSRFDCEPIDRFTRSGIWDLGFWVFGILDFTKMSDDDRDPDHEYKALANSLKDEGNVAFQTGDIDTALRLFTQGIELDPDNYILYSNRSAAYMKADSISKALHDAEKCVELAPAWAKGYNRLGVAQQRLTRFDAAIDTFKKGIELEPNNQALWAALKACEEASKADKAARCQAAAVERAAEEARLRRRNEVREEIFKDKAEDMLNDFLAEVSAPEGVAEDDLLASFLSDVSATAAPSVPALPSALAAEEETGAVLTAKYAAQDLGSGQQQVERLLGRHAEWRNLNPFTVLQLDSDATEEDVKLRYKKLSLKVHPDRLRDLPNARDAFEIVKAAHARLLDADQRRTLVAHMDNVTSDLLRERRGDRSGSDFEEVRQRRIMKHFAELEQMRRKGEANRRAYSTREKMQESEEVQQMGRRVGFEKDWAEEGRRDGRVHSWRGFQQQGHAADADDEDAHDAKRPRVRATNFKEEARADKKHGVAQVETWKKTWR